MFETWMEANKFYNERKELTYAKFITCVVFRDNE